MNFLISKNMCHANFTKAVVFILDMLKEISGNCSCDFFQRRYIHLYVAHCKYPVKWTNPLNTANGITKNKIYICHTPWSGNSHPTGVLEGEFRNPYPSSRLKMLLPESRLQKASSTENVKVVTSPHTPLRHCCCYWEALFTRPTFLRKNLYFKLPHPFRLCSFWVRTKSFVSLWSWDPIWRVLRRISCVLCENFMRICGVCAFLLLLFFGLPLCHLHVERERERGIR